MTQVGPLMNSTVLLPATLVLEVTIISLCIQLGKRLISQCRITSYVVIYCPSCGHEVKEPLGALCPPSGAPSSSYCTSWVSWCEMCGVPDCEGCDDIQVKMMRRVISRRRITTKTRRKMTNPTRIPVVNPSRKITVNLKQRVHLINPVEHNIDDGLLK